MAEVTGVDILMLPTDGFRNTIIKFAIGTDRIDVSA